MNEKLADRIGALLAKAESTDSPHEAEALVAKAQQLATLHAVDLAAARQRSARRRRREGPAQRKVVIGPRSSTGRRHRVALFLEVAHVNDVRVDIARDSTYVLAFGFPSDLDVVDALYASLAAQMAAAGDAAIRRGEHREEVYWSPTARTWRSDARVFRTAFNSGFVVRIGERLEAARAAALAERPAASGGANGDAAADVPEGGALVLARKADEVAAFHAATSDARGTWKGARSAPVAWSDAGYDAGVAAGQAARLGGQDALPGARGHLPGSGTRSA